MACRDTLKLKSNIYDVDNENKLTKRPKSPSGDLQRENKGGVTAIQELYQNNLLTDLETRKSSMVILTRRPSIKMLASSPTGTKDLDKIMSEAKKLSINWHLQLLRAAKNFPSLQNQLV